MTKQTFAKGGIAAGVVLIIGALGAARFQLSMGDSKPKEQGLSRSEWANARATDKAELMSAINDVKTDIREIRSDVKDINGLLIDMARKDRIRVEATALQ